MVIVAIAALVANILLVLVTAYYVVFAKRLLDAAVAANKQNQEISERNQRLHLYPQVFCHVEIEGPQAFLVLENLGQTAAVDVDLLSMATYSEDQVPVDDFVAEFVEKARSIPSLKADDDGLYSVSGRSVYYHLPPRRQVRAPLSVPIPPDYFHVLIQFRDVLGNNYYRIYWMFRQNPEDSRLRIGAVDPPVASTTDRFGFGDPGRTKLEAEAGGQVPPEVSTSEFAQLWPRSISDRFLKGPRRDVEDPGEWSDL